MGIQKEKGLGEFHRKAIVNVELPCRPDQAHTETSEDTPIALFVGIGQGGTGNSATDTKVVKFGLMGAQASLNITQALAVG